VPPWVLLGASKTTRKLLLLRTKHTHRAGRGQDGLTNGVWDRNRGIETHHFTRTDAPAFGSSNLTPVMTARRTRLIRRRGVPFVPAVVWFWLLWQASGAGMLSPNQAPRAGSELGRRCQAHRAHAIATENR
jgi:hypothetical protein